MAAATKSKVTTQHPEIRRWAEERSGKPIAVRPQNGNHSRVVGIKFPGSEANPAGKEIGWDEWFEKFDAAKLAFLYQEQTADGEDSNFHEIVTRKSVDIVESAVGGRGRSAARKRLQSRKLDERGRRTPDGSTARRNGSRKPQGQVEKALVKASPQQGGRNSADFRPSF